MTTQFARDSRSSIGGIRHASQGLFEILPRDEAPGIREESQIQKKVRVVSTWAVNPQFCHRRRKGTPR